MRMRGCRFELQRVLFEKLQKQKAVVQNRCIFDLMLVKPKWVWEAAVYLKDCKQTAEKLILALPMKVESKIPSFLLRA